jgi:hypothetical protein
MPLSAEFSVEGDSTVQAHSVSFGQTVNLALLSLTGVRDIAWTIGDPDSDGSTAGTSHASLVAPTITPAGAPTGATASFPMVADPGDGEGRSVTVKCKVTGQNGATAVAYRIVGVPNAAGIVPFCVDEALYRDATMGWTAEINTLLAGDHSINVRTYGVTGDGVTDDTDAIDLAFTTLNTNGGGVIYFPAGDYLIARPAASPAGADSGGVEVQLTASIKVECAPDARFFTDDLDNDLIRFTVPSDGDGLPTEKITVEWDGGYFDTSSQRNSTSVPFDSTYTPANVGSSATCDALSIRGSYSVSMTGSPNLTFAEVGATGDTITRSAGSWITDGFAINDTITVAGSASNNVTGRIAGLTATALTLDATDLANEGPVGSVTVTAPKNGMAKVTVKNVRVRAGSHWETAGGDAGIFIDGADHIDAGEGCEFIGCRDLGIYASGNASGAPGSSTELHGSRYVNCFFGCAVKRGLEGFSVHDNEFDGCVAGVQVNTLTETSDYGVITANTFRRCSYFVVASEGSSHLRVHDNALLSIGAYLENGTTPVAVYESKCTGFRMLGVTHSFIHDEACMTIGTGHTADLVRLDEYSSTQSENNVLSNLRCYDFDAVVREEATADNNRIELCYNYGSAGNRNPITVGASTSVIRWVPIASAPGCWSFHTGLLLGDGTLAAPILCRAADTNLGFYFAAGEIHFANGGSDYFHATSAGFFSDTGPFFSPVGTAAAPAYAFSSDTDCGMYRVGANKVGLSAGGTRRLEANATNGIEIPLLGGTLTPTNNGDMVFELTNDTTLTVRVKGSDGSTRSVALTLA